MTRIPAHLSVAIVIIFVVVSRCGSWAWAGLSAIRRREQAAKGISVLSSLNCSRSSLCSREEGVSNRLSASQPSPSAVAGTRLKK